MGGDEGAAGEEAGIDMITFNAPASDDISEEFGTIWVQQRLQEQGP